MRIMLILASTTALAILFNLKWIGDIVLLFIVGCALFGFADFIHDCFDGYGFSIKGQMKRAAKGTSWIKL